MGISCQQNGHWAATSHLSGRGLVQPIKELSSAAGRCARRGCALIRQLANSRVPTVREIQGILRESGKVRENREGQGKVREF